MAIPYINVNHQSAKEFNKRISTVYKQKAETIKNQISTTDVIYTVQYKAYLQNNILSLAIKASTFLTLSSAFSCSHCSLVSQWKPPIPGAAVAH